MPFLPDSAFETGPSYASLVRADERLTEGAFAAIDAVYAALDTANAAEASSQSTSAPGKATSSAGKAITSASVKQIETPIEDVETMLKDVEAIAKDIEVSVMDVKNPLKHVEVAEESIKAEVAPTEIASEPMQVVRKVVEAVLKSSGAAKESNEDEVLSEQEPSPVAADVDAKVAVGSGNSTTTAIGDTEAEVQGQSKIVSERKVIKTSGPASILCGGPCGKCKPRSEYHPAQVKAYLDPMNADPIRCMLCCMPTSSNGGHGEIQEEDGEFVLVDIDSDDDE